MNHRLAPFFEKAKKAGYKMVEEAVTRGGHTRVLVTGPLGLQFHTNLPSTPSDLTRGPLNFVSSLKKQERKLQEVQMEQTNQKLSTEDMLEIKQIMRNMADNEDLLLVMKIRPGNGRECALNTTRGMKNGRLPVRLFDYLFEHGLIQKADIPESPALEGKDLYSLSIEGLREANKLTPIEKELSIPESGTLEERIDEIIEEAKGSREIMIANALQELTDEEVTEILYYGFEMLKDDLERKHAEVTSRLNRIKGGPECLSSQ